MDLTPGPERYSLPGHDRDCALAIHNQAKISRRTMPLDEIQVMHLLQIGFRAGDRAGREEAARDVERVARSTRESLVRTPPEYAREAAWHRVRAEAFERAALIARGGDQRERLADSADTLPN